MNVLNAFKLFTLTDQFCYMDFTSIFFKKIQSRKWTELKGTIKKFYIGNTDKCTISVIRGHLSQCH